MSSVGMYSKKLFSNKQDCFTPTGTLGGSDVAKKVTPSRYLGKQFKTSPSKEQFNVIKYETEGITGPIRYSEREPVADRKISFGSKDASRRDEFSSTTAVQAYKEKLKKEQSVNKKLALQVDVQDSNGNSNSETLFDRLNNKDLKQPPSFAGKRKIQELNLGSCTTTNKSYGEGLDTMVASKAMFGRLNVCREFNNPGHLESTSF